MSTVHFVLFLSTLVLASSEVIQLNSSNWQDCLKGEWMIEFYAPWCPACRQFGPTWESFSTTPMLKTKVAAVDVTESPVLSFLFFVSRLPTIFYAKDGSFWLYEGTQNPQDLLNYVSSDEARSKVEPISWYYSPSSWHMRGVFHFMELGMIVTNTHNRFLSAGYSTWTSYGMIAGGTVVFGLVLGTVLVVLCDCFFPPRPQILRLFTKRTDVPADDHVKPSESVESASDGENDNSDAEVNVEETSENEDSPNDDQSSSASEPVILEPGDGESGDSAVIRKREEGIEKAKR